ncbi:DUF2637 domain-containing protein [Cellulosimicrobium sp. XJ-DQ-B-000]|uniref:DUF2637 domain-containing protein n=1 Tax=Cellulosimicrobium sp. XJ-DQ-B-000 TaxID=3072182 RepID=UPI0028075C9C|nr:DUF2637 domain-containing protein [Cellulosimicrobium sp. XJ-DQ-B-000]MDQ8040608.1 DUF2637 domain-containing protein [Cellulosimicrobium sp. XJ-DQ-B-000]
MSGHQPARINPDTRAALGVAMLATSALVSISFVLSFAGLSALAPWAAVPGHLSPLVPLFIDGAILVYTYSALAARARHESAARPWTWVALWTLVSSTANAAHAWAMGPGGWEGIVGATLAGLFPIGSLLGCHEIADRMIARPGHQPDTTVPTPDTPVQLVVHPVPDTSAALLENVPTTVTDRDARILELHGAGLSVRAIAGQTGVSKTTVHNVIVAAGVTA